MKKLLFLLLFFASVPVWAQTHIEIGKLNSSIVYADQFGARCDGSDAAPAIRAALAVGQQIYIPACPTTATQAFYSICSMDSRTWFGLQWMFWITANQTVEGLGATQFKVGTSCLNATTQGGGVFFENVQDHVTLKHLYIDMNGANNLVPNCSCYHPDIAFFFEGGNYDTADDVTVLNSPGANDVVSGGAGRSESGTNFTLINSTLHNGGTFITGNSHQGDFSFAYTEATYSRFENNHIFNDGDTTVAFQSGGIEIHGNYSEASHNTIEYAFPAFYVNSPLASQDIIGINIHDNILNNVGEAVSFFGVQASDFRQIKFDSNKVLLRKNANFSQPLIGLSMGRDDTGSYNYRGILYDSQFLGNSFTSVAPTTDFSLAFRLSSVNNILIAGNHCFNLGSECIALTANPYSAANVLIQGNDAYNIGQSSGPYLVAINYDTGSLTLGTWAGTHAYTVLSGGALYILPSPLNGYIFKYTASGTSGSGQPNCTSLGQVITDGTATLTCTAPWAVSGITIVNNTASWPSAIGGFIVDVTDTPSFSLFSSNQYSNFTSSTAATKAAADITGTTAAIASFPINLAPSATIYNTSTVSGISQLTIRSQATQTGLSEPLFRFIDHTGALKNIVDDSGNFSVYEDTGAGWAKQFCALNASNVALSCFGHRGVAGGALTYSYIGSDFSAPWWKVDSSGNVTETGSLTVPQIFLAEGGTLALSTSPIGGHTCSSAQTLTATGTTTSSVVSWSFASTPITITGYGDSVTPFLVVTAFPTSNTANIVVCNTSASSITPGAISVNIRVMN